mmetsp:Transcript_13116/g.28468  ORF Transcript_13116/g.28468 Transcript_13116/m.28468 type:complete len:154 (+) Transcript_13116:145-606(+)
MAHNADATAPAIDAVTEDEGRAGSTVNTNISTDGQTQRRGMWLRTIKPGDGENYPSAGDTVRTHYQAFLLDSGGEPGEKFDSSRDKGHTFLWKVGHNQVIEGMDKAIVRMSKGQIAEATIPYELAYGEQGYPPVIPPKSNLLFEIELIDISSL